MAQIQVIQGGVTTAQGFLAAGAHIGLRKKRKDLALLQSENGCNWAATFTTNTMKAAPVLWNQALFDEGEQVKAIVVNSAIANSCTGKLGDIHAMEMAKTTAAALGVEISEVLVASTGVIGTFLPIELVKSGIVSTAKKLAGNAAAGGDAAIAITTTDTCTKEVAVTFEVGGCLVTLGGMAKGSGMVHPNMATTLGFLTTDLNIESNLLRKALKESVAGSFNMISVDGDTSTNDMVILLANGMAGNELISCEDEGYAIFKDALDYVTTEMAKMVAADGEGASKLLEVSVSGAQSVEDARALARSVITSSLVKVAMFGNDTNWGRIVAAMGACGVPFDLDNLQVSIAGHGMELDLIVDGMPYWFDENACKEILEGEAVAFKIEIGDGAHEATAWGCDLTFDYIRKGARYRLEARAGEETGAMEAQGEVA